jgi:hypothetical protein
LQATLEAEFGLQESKRIEERVETCKEPTVRPEAVAVFEEEVETCKTPSTRLEVVPRFPIPKAVESFNVLPESKLDSLSPEAMPNSEAL